MTIEEIYENARRKLDRSEITIGEFAEIVIEILDWLYQMDRKSLGEDICEGGHHFPKGKYDFCPICGCKFKTESEDKE